MPGRPDDYEVLLTIGAGSYGKCRKVRRKADGKILVWKELDYGMMTESEKQMLVSEVNLLRELRHPNIVRYYDRIIDRSSTTLYIVMEYCDGGDLASLIAKCAKERHVLHFLDESFVLRVLTQLTLALKECHRRSDGGVTVHRDLKPANVFLDSKQNVKLGDFGLARILHHDTSFATTPPFTAYNQKELAEKIREGRFRRIPYRYSDELNDLLREMLNVKDYCRPSVEDILQHPLIEAMATEEQKQNLDSRLVRSWEPERAQYSDAAMNELKRKEQQLQEREQAIKEREQRLEQKERELCVRERLAKDKLARAESLMKRCNPHKQQQEVTCAEGPDNALPLPLSTTKKNSLLDGSEEKAVPPHNMENYFLSKGKNSDLKSRLYAANLRAQALAELEKSYQLKSRQILGMPFTG
ncbi:hypothetical protein IHE44_0009021 [Lamprotornis superbus]|uniref:non-specific serine/threonine protein kinase n=1 Tax=Lamprotornis superbus TaxID=245042 RepID=A0A835U1F3_9PASS|nr:hypothetical protein IHE44_0009021 [Lamprotornis superbus]